MRHIVAILSVYALLSVAGCATVEQSSAGLVAPATVGPQDLASDFPYRKAKGGYPTLAPLLRRVTPAVVNISVQSEIELEEHPLAKHPDLRRLLEMFDVPLPPSPKTGRRQSVGSGVIIDGGRGLILTNRHVIEDARSITVTLKNQQTLNAELLGSDDDADIAVLKLESIPAGLRALGFGNSDDLEVGDFVLAIGNPFGIGQTVTSGIVSALGRDGLGDLIQTDASINPGNSGGPLVDLAGRVVGLNTALIGPTGSNVGIGFAMPSNRVRVAMRRVLTNAGALVP